MTSFYTSGTDAVVLDKDGKRLTEDLGPGILISNPDNVNHPKHYNIPGRKECIEEMLDKYGPYITMVFCLTNSYKYLYRAGYKENNPKEQDIKKAKTYFLWAEKHKWAIENSNLMNLYRDIEAELQKYESR